jgi:hypothetical protein
MSPSSKKQTAYDEEQDGKQNEDKEHGNENNKRSFNISKKRRKAKLVGYRQLSKTAGYTNTQVDDLMLPIALDCTNSLLSEGDAKRLIRYYPLTPGAVGFNTNEFKKRFELSKCSVSKGAARITQVKADAIMRRLINQALLQSVEYGKKTISASTMASVLRQYAALMEFTSVVPPIGLIRYGQENGIIKPADEADIKKRSIEKKESNANKKMYITHMEHLDKLKKERKEKKENALTAAKEAAAMVEAS